MKVHTDSPKPYLRRVTLYVKVDDESGERSRAFEIRTDKLHDRVASLYSALEREIEAWIRKQ